ncbi:MAG: 1-acyl-sn-glycerol-3-phosphate acyltransferase, partial [Lentisphaerae bacterium]|nr:1-acyl-sn-glycerol-3-phosphate acyltransferase [Lentisphaerota bacterium]
YGWMNRLLHIREINEIIFGNTDGMGIDFVVAALEHFKVSFDFQGTENLPKEGQYIFASNHPLGGFDCLILINGVHKFLGPSLFLARDELTKIPQLKEFFIPINKFGNQRKSVSQINAAYKTDKQILIFPAGLASRRKHGIIRDLEWHKHFIQKSIEHKRNVIPVFMSGRNSSFFYFLSNFRQFIGLKLNIEMFLLPNEMFRQKGKKFTITFGKPIPWQTFDSSKTHSQWAQEVKNMGYQLPTGRP